MKARQAGIYYSQGQTTFILLRNIRSLHCTVNALMLNARTVRAILTTVINGCHSKSVWHVILINGLDPRTFLITYLRSTKSKQYENLLVNGVCRKHAWISSPCLLITYSFFSWWYSSFIRQWSHIERNHKSSFQSLCLNKVIREIVDCLEYLLIKRKEDKVTIIQKVMFLNASIF